MDGPLLEFVKTIKFAKTIQFVKMIQSVKTQFVKTTFFIKTIQQCLEMMDMALCGSQLSGLQSMWSIWFGLGHHQNQPVPRGVTVMEQHHKSAWRMGCNGTQKKALLRLRRVIQLMPEETRALGCALFLDELDPQFKSLSGFEEMLAEQQTVACQLLLHQKRQPKRRWKHGQNFSVFLKSLVCFDFCPSCLAVVCFQQSPLVWFAFSVDDLMPIRF